MKREYFIAQERRSHDSVLPLQEVIGQLAFDDQGLIPVITQDVQSGEVLMFAWMNKEALEKTLSTGRMTYWSRSRQQFWEKGESSGHTQSLRDMSFDCDGDAVLCQVEQKGAACHTGRQSCFYLRVDADRQAVVVRHNAI